MDGDNWHDDDDGASCSAGALAWRPTRVHTCTYTSSRLICAAARASDAMADDTGAARLLLNPPRRRVTLSFVRLMDWLIPIVCSTSLCARDSSTAGNRSTGIDRSEPSGSRATRASNAARGPSEHGKGTNPEPDGQAIVRPGHWSSGAMDERIGVSDTTQDSRGSVFQYRFRQLFFSCGGSMFRRCHLGRFGRASCIHIRTPDGS